MNILVITGQLPYPLTEGGRKAVYYPLRWLAARGHHIHLASLSTEEAAEGVRALREFCVVDNVVSPKNRTLGGLLRSVLSATPYDLSRFHNAELLAKIRTVLATKSPDLVQVEGIHAAFYALEAASHLPMPMVHRVHNVHWMNLERFAAQSRNPLIKAAVFAEARKVQRYELRVSERFDMNLTISDRDASVLQSRNPRIRCTTVPAGVDLAEFQPGGRTEDPLSVLWLGALGWKPNQESFWWFYRDIIPRLVEIVPDVSISVAGSNAPAEILAVRHRNVRVLGFVDDVADALGRAQVCVVPLRVGSGIRIKLLEMLAMKKAVVSTSVGCEGLGLVHGRHLLIADEPGPFAQAVADLLADPRRRDELGRNGRSHIERFFSWERIGEQYEAAYVAVINEHAERR